MSGYVDYDRESAKCAYEAYRRATVEAPRPDEPMPDWDKLPVSVQNAWIAAADAVRKYESERTSQF